MVHKCSTTQKQVKINSKIFTDTPVSLGGFFDHHPPPPFGNIENTTSRSLSYLDNSFSFGMLNWVFWSLTLNFNTNTRIV